MLSLIFSPRTLAILEVILCFFIEEHFSPFSPTNLIVMFFLFSGQRKKVSKYIVTILSSIFFISICLSSFIYLNPLTKENPNFLVMFFNAFFFLCYKNMLILSIFFFISMLIVFKNRNYKIQDIDKILSTNQSNSNTILLVVFLNIILVIFINFLYQGRDFSDFIINKFFRGKAIDIFSSMLDGYTTHNLISFSYEYSYALFDTISYTCFLLDIVNNKKIHEGELSFFSVKINPSTIILLVCSVFNLFWLSFFFLNSFIFLVNLILLMVIIGWIVAVGRNLILIFLYRNSNLSFPYVLVLFTVLRMLPKATITSFFLYFFAYIITVINNYGKVSLEK